MRKFWLLCLCLASLGLVGCFHIPDEDRLPSKNKVENWNIQQDGEMQQALNSFIDWINMISSDRNELKNEENNGTTAEDVENIEVETWNIQQDEEIIDNEVENNVIEENITPEE
jgi:hypothetical protein